MKEKFIDVEHILESKNPKLRKWIPGFIVRYLKKIIHQEEINQILMENEAIYGYDFCMDIIKRFRIKVEVLGADNIPKDGGCILASNHPLGGMDAMAIIHGIAPYRRDVKFIVNDILLNLKNLKGLFVGVNKHGSKSKSSLNAVNELFDSSNAIFLFPAGLVSRRKKGKIEDLEWKKTFISRAKKFNKPVVPVYVDGRLSNFFYNLSNLREKLGIKANIEMLYLADEMFKQQDQTVRIIFGEPINPAIFDATKSDKDWAKWVKEGVYALDRN